MSLNLFTAVAALQHFFFVLLFSGTLATEQAASWLHTLLCLDMHCQHKTCTVAPNDCTPSRRPAFLSVELYADTLEQQQQQRCPHINKEQ